MPEEIVVRPLTGEEVQEAVLHKIRESMARSCNLLATNGYTSFRAEIEIHLTLSDYGREVPDNHKVIVQEPTKDAEYAEVGEARKTYETTVTMEPKPPNQVLVESDQKVEVRTTEDGRQVIRNVRYNPRKTVPPAPKDPFNR